MNCRVCNSSLPSGASACPNCGSMVTNDGYRPTLTGTPQPAKPQQIPTSYGSDPYSTPGTTPPAYNPASTPSYYSNTPYAQPPVYIPPTPTPKKGNKVALIVTLSILLPLLLCGGSIFGLLKLADYGNNLAHTEATATAIANTNIPPVSNSSQNPYSPKKGTLVLNDPLQNNSKGYKWDEQVISGKNASDGTAECGFSGRAYHITRQQKGGLTCNPEATALNLNNVAFEANLTIIKGDAAGLIVRVDQTLGTGYLFVVDTKSNYSLYLVDFSSTDAAKASKTLFTGTSAVIKQGLNQSNLLGIVANNTTISVYANNQFIQSVQEGTYSSGQIGVYGNNGQGALDVTAANARAWSF